MKALAAAYQQQQQQKRTLQQPTTLDASKLHDALADKEEELQLAKVQISVLQVLAYARSYTQLLGNC